MEELDPAGGYGRSFPVRGASPFKVVAAADSSDLDRVSKVSIVLSFSSSEFWTSSVEMPIAKSVSFFRPVSASEVCLVGCWTSAVEISVVTSMDFVRSVSAFEICAVACEVFATLSINLGRFPGAFGVSPVISIASVGCWTSSAEISVVTSMTFGPSASDVEISVLKSIG